MAFVKIVLTQYVLTKPASPQTAQLDIHLCVKPFTSQIQMHILEGPDKGHSDVKGNKRQVQQNAKQAAGSQPMTS